MKHPTPSALRLLTAASRRRTTPRSSELTTPPSGDVPSDVPSGKPPRPPFGLKRFDPDAPSVAILLDESDGDLRDPAVIARQLPDPATLPALSLVFVLGTSAPRQGLLGRWFGVGATLVPTATRCSALLARGYVGIGAFVDGLSSADLVYATSSEPSVTDLG